jgi:hypothetical protein
MKNLGIMFISSKFNPTFEWHFFQQQPTVNPIYPYYTAFYNSTLINCDFVVILRCGRFSRPFGTGQVVHLLWRSTVPAIGFLHMPKASPGENQLQVGISFINHIQKASLRGKS